MPVILLTILKFLSPKEWFLIAALISFVGWSWHERRIGEQECLARVAKVEETVVARVEAESNSLAPYLDKYNALNEALANHAPPNQTDFSCPVAGADIVRRANTH